MGTLTLTYENHSEPTDLQVARNASNVMMTIQHPGRVKMGEKETIVTVHEVTRANIELVKARVRECLNLGPLQTELYNDGDTAYSYINHAALRANAASGPVEGE